MIRSIAAAAAIAFLAPASAPAEDDAQRIRRAVAYTVASQLPNGLFRYDFDFLAAQPSGDDNIVRQAGTLFALGEYLADTGDPAVIAPIEAGLAALAQRSLPIGTGAVQSWLQRAGVFRVESWRLERALASRGWLFAREGEGRVISGKNSYADASAGATALALLAELSLHRATGEERFAEERVGWLHGLLALRVPGSGVRNSPEALATGAYPDGETWLALARYHDALPDDARAASALSDLEEYLLAHYRAEPDREFYHWGALASAARLSGGDPARLADFAADQAEFALREVPPEKTGDDTSCALVEGLGSAVAVIRAQPGREALVDRLEQRIAQELAKNRGLQIGAGQRRITLGGRGELRAPSLADSAGAFLAGRYRAFTRIDLTQHCISAFLIAKRHGLGGRDGRP